MLVCFGAFLLAVQGFPRNVAKTRPTADKIGQKVGAQGPLLSLLFSTEKYLITVLGFGSFLVHVALSLLTEGLAAETQKIPSKMIWKSHCSC